jgi:hypothetical protein
VLLVPDEGRVANHGVHVRKLAPKLRGGRRAEEVSVDQVRAEAVSPHKRGGLIERRFVDVNAEDLALQFACGAAKLAQSLTCCEQEGSIPTARVENTGIGVVANRPGR